MAVVVNRMRCFTCSKENAITKCEGCSNTFCFNDFGNHRQELNKNLDEIETNRDLIRQQLNERTKEPKTHPLLQQIDQWESESINKIKQAAEENRKSVFSFITKHNNRLENKLNELTDQLKQSRQENDFIEANLDQWKTQLTQIQEELIKPSNIEINYDSTPFITKIHTYITTPLWISNINIDANWIQNGITVAGGNGSGSGLNQLSAPWGVYVDDEQSVYVADSSNHRIVEWKNGATSGRLIAGGKGRGDRNDQLNYPANVILDSDSDCLIICNYGNKRVVQWSRRNGASGETIISDVGCWNSTMDEDRYIYVCDYDKHEVRRWKMGETNGTVVAGGNGLGNRLDQLNGPRFICVDHDLSVYVSDCDNHRVMKWLKGAKEGIIIAGGHGKGNDLTQLSGPYGIAVDQLGTVYVADYHNNRIVRWLRGATEGSIVVGGNGEGEEANQLNGPCDLSFDRQNNLYVTDSRNYRVQKFSIELNLANNY